MLDELTQALAEAREFEALARRDRERKDDRVEELLNMMWSDDVIVTVDDETEAVVKVVEINPKPCPHTRAELEEQVELSARDLELEAEHLRTWALRRAARGAFSTGAPIIRTPRLVRARPREHRARRTARTSGSSRGDPSEPDLNPPAAARAAA